VWGGVGPPRRIGKPGREGAWDLANPFRVLVPKSFGVKARQKWNLTLFFSGASNFQYEGEI
jgi:hypothetical protein